MSSQPTLSVVVPFYGVEDYLQECLESIAAQTLSDMQVVLVDDGSPDNSIDIAERFAAGDSRFTVIRQENAGLGPARNTGASHAVGKYLTFVDSDDIVPRRAYEHMVGSLERTGSSFAVGNAKRFSRTSGVRQSWAHSKPCAKDRTATHILEQPTLAYDRMVWNKVYRKDFYDERAYTFPPIKYEDWPVTMRAHLEALTVDVLRMPTYYWRERESGDSITQQVFKYENLLDRVISAEQVFDVLDALASPSVKSMAHRHLVEIDMVAVAQAFAVAEDSDVDRLLTLSQRFVTRLESPHAGETRYNKLQYHALMAGDAELLRDLARFREQGGLVGGTSVRRNLVKPWRWTLNYPGKGRSTAPGNLYELPFTALKLDTLVTSCKWDGHTLELVARTEIGHVPASRSDEVTVSLVNGINRIPLETEIVDTIDAYRKRGPAGVRFRVTMDQIVGLSDLVWPLRFEVARTSQGVSRRRMLTGAGAGSPQFPLGQFLTREQYVQPGLTTGNVFCLHRVAFPAVLESVDVRDGGLVLRGSVSEPARTASVVVRRPSGPLEFAADLTRDGGTQRFEAVLDPAEILLDDSADDPFLHTASRRVSIRTEFGDIDLTWPTYDGDAVVVVDEPTAADAPRAPEGTVAAEPSPADAPDAPTHGGGAAGTRVTLTRSRFGIATLTHGPVMPSVRSAVERHGVLELVGPHYGLPVDGHLWWRKYLPDSDDHVDVPLEVSYAGDEFVARTRLADLIPEEDLPTQPGAPAADHTLFFDAGAYDSPVVIQPAALVQLPIERLVEERTVLVTSIADGTRVQVR